MAKSSCGVLRVAITVLASTAMSVVVAPVVGEFFIGIAKENHIYELPYKWPGAVMSWLTALSELPWLREAALFLTGLAIGMWFDTIVRRRRARKNEEFIPQAGMVSINEIEFSTGRLKQPAPWLELYLTCFNASGYEVRPIGVTGRVNVSGEEFHSRIELIDILKTCGNAQFCRVGIKIPVSASEAQHCVESIHGGTLIVAFSGSATLTFGVAIYGKSGPAPEINISLPGGVRFDPDTLRTDPYLPWHNPLNFIQNHTL
jgi:hypothetical protein